MKRLSLFGGVLLFLALLLSTSSCDEVLPGNRKVKPVDRQTVNRVVKRVLALIETDFQVKGPKCVADLPGIKNDAARTEGFTDWLHFKRHLDVDATGRREPAEVRISRKITAKLQELLAAESPKRGTK